MKIKRVIKLIIVLFIDLGTIVSVSNDVSMFKNMEVFIVKFEIRLLYLTFV